MTGSRRPAVSGTWNRSRGHIPKVQFVLDEDAAVTSLVNANALSDITWHLAEEFAHTILQRHRKLWPENTVFVASLARGCMYVQPMMPPRPPLKVVKLSDHFGQYVLTLSCACGHSRSAQARTLAALAGWDALLDTVVRRMRCSRCGGRRCSASVRPETKRDR